MIRHDKFNYVLPNAMRRNNIDMWIVIDHGCGTEPMLLDFGIETAYGQGIYVFYDGGGDRIERLLKTLIKFARSFEKMSAQERPVGSNIMLSNRSFKMPAMSTRKWNVPVMSRVSR
jgi:hypothetical protein